MASSSSSAAAAGAGVAALGRLVDRTRVPDPTLQRHAVAALFRHLLTSVPPPLPSAAHDALSSLLASPHPAVAAHAAASVARLAASRADLLSPELALPLLIAPLSASPSPRLASCFVKAVAALVSCALRSGAAASRFPPHDHPFVQALASGADGARAELQRQAARLVAEGVHGVVGFLRPFVMFAAVRKGDTAFVKDLIGALAAAAVAAARPDSAVPVLKLLAECLLHFGRGDGEEVRLWLSSVECLVDAYVVLLRKFAHAQMATYDAQANSVELIEMLLSQCSLHHQFMGNTSVVLGLSKHLFLAQKDLGLCYLPEISVVLSSLAFILSGLEFEHEQLSGLKLLAFLIEWRHENALRTNEAVHHFSEEIVCVLPVINLVISPSKSVKSVASHVLSRFHICWHLVHLNNGTAQWGLAESAGNSTEPNYWTHQINKYLSALRKEKLTLDSLSSKKIQSVAISSLLSSAVSVLVMHPKIGTSAAQSLALLGATDPKLGMPLLVLILFYTKVLYSNNNCDANILLSLLESLPSLAVHGFVLPLSLQLISSMLKKDVKSVLYPIAVRLLCKMWTVTDWAFQNLQGTLDPENFPNSVDDREVFTSIAASVRDVCKQNPDRGVDLILSVSACIESRDSVVQALGLESLSYLCEEDVVDFYTAWKVISKQLLDFSIDPTVSHGLCILLRWGAMDSEAYPGTSKHLIQILWSIGTYREKNADPLWVKARGTAFQSLSHYKLLDAFPQAVFKGKSAHHRFPGAALLTLNFTPKDILHEGKSKDLPRVHAAYEQALVEMAESMYISRNMVVALLALHSWKSFVSNWMQAVIACLDTKESSKLNKASKAADDIFKILCKCVPVSTPRVVVSIALAIGALCLVISKTESYLVKGACGLGLGYCCQALLARADNAADSELEATTQLTERASVEEILHTLTTSLVQLCPFSCYSLKKLSICGIKSLEGMEEKYVSLEDDPWAVAGLVLGLGNSVVSLYRLGAYEAIIEVKNILISWIPEVDSSSLLFDEEDSALLCMGSCLALPSVLAFCQKVELLNDDLDALFNRYTSLATNLLSLKKSGTIFQNLLMAVCIGAGSFLSSILNDGVHAMKFTDVKDLLDTLKHIYTHPYPPLVHLGGMLGTVNAFGAGDLTGICRQPTNSQIKHEKPDSMVSTSTVATVLRCLSKAPRLPSIDWGVIVRRCMNVEAHIPDMLTNHHDPKLLREECLYISLAHASHISPLLHFIDDLTDLSRFRRLEINLQSILLQYLSTLMKLFSLSRLDKLSEDLTEYLYSPTSLYLDYSSEQRSMLRTSFWKGIRECLVEDVSEESSGFSCIKKCIQSLSPLLSLHKDGQPEFIEEWSAAIKCHTVAQKGLLGDMLQVEISSSFSELEHIDVAKKVIIRARMCSSGCGSVDELGNIKTTILRTRLDGVWWNVLVEVAGALYYADSRMKKQWLLDALDIGCVTAHPSTVLHFVGLLCGSCCIYMPLLIVNPINVLSDLPVTLPSFLSSSIWDDLRNSVADKLWLLTVRIYTWAEQLTHSVGLARHDHIHGSEAEMAIFLANILRCTCVAVEDHLAVEKKLKLANLEAL
uniref:DUF3730 domain-containing protein n=1 Tax=Oryza meridionalis TaxID=40149 RepID=A0A0E0BXQ2_9ORYZ